MLQILSLYIHGNSLFSKFSSKCFNNFTAEALPDPNGNSTVPVANAPEVSSTLATMNISEDELSAREDVINNKMNEDSTMSIENKLAQTQNTALKALSREMNIEEKLKREEMMKAKAETKVLVVKMNKEKKKKKSSRRRYRSKSNPSRSSYSNKSS